MADGYRVRVYLVFTSPITNNTPTEYSYVKTKERTGNTPILKFFTLKPYDKVDEYQFLRAVLTWIVHVVVFLSLSR